MLMHPEYQHLFQNPEKAQDQDYFQTLGETNPFLHLGLHLTILEQLSLNQPQGITDLYQQSVLRFGEPHQAHHCLMNSLAIGLNELLSNQKPFDEAAYLERIRKAVKDGSW
jgi:hypothetical protein